MMIPTSLGEVVLVMLVDLSAGGHVIIHCESLLVPVLVVDHGPVVNLDALVLIDTSAVDAGKKSERCSGSW